MPPPDLTISEWADEYRRLSPEASAEPGRWDTSRAEYQRGMMQAVSDPGLEQVVFMTSSQIGKTEIINNIVGYHIHQDPSPMLVVQPTLDMAKSWSQERLAPMLRDTPVLSGLIADPRARDSGNTVLHKMFTGGHITACGANSPASLASRPIRVVLCDEVDRYPPSAGSEGDPIALAKRRSTTFWNKKIILVSTPTNKGASRIEAAFEESDQRHFYVPCPDCGHEQTLKWSNVHWQEKRPDTAAYACEECGSAWDDPKRYRAIKKGKWVAHAEFGGTAGFHLNGIYSPWVPLSDAVQDFLTAKKDPMRLRTWINTFLGESWEDEGEGVDDLDLSTRKEDFGPIPDDVVVITAGIDVQDDRLEYEIVGWAKDHESYSLDYHVIYGDPSNPTTWTRLDEALSVTWEHPILGEIGIRGSCIDSGGHHTQSVYNYVRTREGRRIWAIKGVGGEGRPIVGKPSKNNTQRVNLYPIGVDTAKELVYAHLKIKDEGPGYCHFPLGREDEYFKQLTAERQVTRYTKGYQKREWVKKRSRNEALDCRVYAIAALTILNVNVNRFSEKLRDKIAQHKEKQVEEPTYQPVMPRPARKVARNSGGFVNSWR